MSAALDLETVEARLRTDVTALQLVGGAADREAVKGKPARLPAAFVIDGVEQGEPSTGGSMVAIQRITYRFGVLVCSRHYRVGERGAAGREDERTIVRGIRGSLVGWRIPPTIYTGEVTPIELVTGQLVAYGDGVRWYLDTYSCRYWSRTP